MGKVYLTIDLEHDPWTNKVPTVETRLLLYLLKIKNQRITWFVTSKLYEENQQLVEEVLEGGHEIGFHGYDHSRITSIEVLKNQLNKSVAFISKFKPLGFRAPYICFPEGGFDILDNFGFKYDSSVYFDKPYVTSNILEIPVYSPRLLKIGMEKPGLPQTLGKALLKSYFPFGSGLVSALMPRLQLKLLTNAQKPVLFIHPWQLSKHAAFTPNFNLALFLYRNSCENLVKEIIGKYSLGKMEELLNEYQNK